ncbi:MAG: CDP-diacylglycerol O-phosphatidyltransferase [Candidatus Binatia bacterium]|nr:CDP-diacylglycerol O-phosphatidyltransferase [Candidatus Binatia bacterium]
MNPRSVPNVLPEVTAAYEQRYPRSRWVSAWAVHAYTASGVVVGFLALRATVFGRAREAFLWMLIAVLIDSTDGILARKIEVKRVLPWFDGAKLDDIIDYFTFVIVPVVFLYHMHLLPPVGTLFFAALPLLSSAYGFCHAAAKTPDFFFTGFPSYWNVVAFYLYAGQTPPWFNGTLICLLSVFVFIPIRYVYPSRTVPFRRLTNLLGGVWAVMLLAVLWQLPTPPRWLVLLSLFYPVYYTLLSFYLHATTRKSS